MDEGLVGIIYYVYMYALHTFVDGIIYHIYICVAEGLVGITYYVYIYILCIYVWQRASLALMISLMLVSRTIPPMMISSKMKWTCGPVGARVKKKKGGLWFPWWWS